MAQFETPEFVSPIDGAEFAIRSPRSPWLVVGASVVILAMAALGFYRGLVSAVPMTAGAGFPSTNAIVGAKPAAPVAQNPNWSVLSGPTVVAPPAAKTQAATVDSSDDNDSPDDQADNADQPPAVGATPTPPAAASAAPAPSAKPLSAAAPASAPEPPPY